MSLVSPESAQETAVSPPSPATSARPRSMAAEWTVTIILLLFGTTTLVQAYVIPTGSMENSLLVGDHLLVDKLSYAPAGALSKHLLPYDDVGRGDVIVFRYPVDIRQTFVKRAIGIPGDHIRLADKRLVLNGRQVKKPCTYHNTDYVDSYRDNSPGVPRDNIIGKPVIIYWSYDAPTEALSDPAIRVNYLIDLILHFPTKTRWSRTFRLIRGYPLR